MSSNLFFICPTDNLEASINECYGEQNYFYTSLGNSFDFDDQTSDYLKKLSNDREIDHMYIVLSIENTIIANATELNWFYNIRGMKEIVDSQQFSQLWYKENGKQFMQLSNFINKKVMQLRQPISEQTFSSVEISGKIYIPKDCLFSDIYSDLIRLNNPQHN